MGGFFPAHEAMLRYIYLLERQRTSNTMWEGACIAARFSWSPAGFSPEMLVFWEIFLEMWWSPPVWTIFPIVLTSQSQQSKNFKETWVVDPTLTWWELQLVGRGQCCTEACTEHESPWQEDRTVLVFQRQLNKFNNCFLPCGLAILHTEHQLSNSSFSFRVLLPVIAFETWALLCISFRLFHCTYSPLIFVPRVSQVRNLLTFHLF